MPHLQHILFPYDFSAPGRQAVPFVRALAKAFDARVTVISEVPPLFEFVPAGMGPRLRIGDDAAEWTRALQSRLDQALLDEFAGLRVARCAVDRTPETPALVQWGAAFSTHLGARFGVLHVVGPISDGPLLETERRLHDHVREEARDAMVSLLTSAGVDVPLRVVVGDIVPTAREDARHEKADLLIIGRGSVSEPFGRLRTHAFGIIQRSPCPVLSV